MLHPDHLMLWKSMIWRRYEMGSAAWFSLPRLKKYLQLAPLFFQKDRTDLACSWMEKKVTNWRHFQWRITTMFRSTSPREGEKAEGIWHIQPGEQLNLEETQEQLSSTYEKYIKMTLPGSSQWPSSKGAKDSGCKLKQETHTGYKDLSDHEDNQTSFPER